MKSECLLVNIQDTGEPQGLLYSKRQHRPRSPTLRPGPPAPSVEVERAPSADHPGPRAPAPDPLPACLGARLGARDGPRRGLGPRARRAAAICRGVRGRPRRHGARHRCATGPGTGPARRRRPSGHGRRPCRSDGGRREHRAPRPRHRHSRRRWGPPAARARAAARAHAARWRSPRRGHAGRHRAPGAGRRVRPGRRAISTATQCWRRFADARCSWTAIRNCRLPPTTSSASIRATGARAGRAPRLPDVFRHWAGARVAATMAAARNHALPAPLAPYAQQFDEHGEWTSMAPYGQVWMPNAAADWRPYVHGSWRYTRYGWTWIDADRWAWPVHHYGRWGRHDQRGWFWIPQRTWGPAWVGWAIAADHVAWSPLGWDARPVMDFFGGARFGPVDVWANSWSILPRRNFGGRDRVFGQLEDPRRLPGSVLGGFVSQMVGPRGPAGASDRYAPRPGRRSWPGSGAGSNGGGPRGGTGRPPARRSRSSDFGSAGAPARGAVAPASRGDDVFRTRRPGDARPSEDAARPGTPVMPVTPPDGAGSRRYGARPDASGPRPTPDGEAPRGTRVPNAIRPRYEPPAAAPAAPPPAAAPEASAPAARERGDGGRERARGGSGVERREPPRNDGASRGSGSAGSGTGARDSGRRERPAGPATAPRGESGSSAGGRRRPG